MPLSPGTNTRLALKLKHVPEGRSVTKLAGTKSYTVARSIPVYGGATLKADPGVVWLIAEGGGGGPVCINAVPEDLEVLVHLTFEGAIKLLQKLTEPTES